MYRIVYQPKGCRNWYMCGESFRTYAKAEAETRLRRSTDYPRGSKIIIVHMGSNS